MASPIALEQTRPSGAGRARGLVSSRQSGSRVAAQGYLASPDMRHLVEQYWAGSWDLREQPPHTTEMLGDPCVHLVFEEGPNGTSSRLVGIWTRLWRRTLEGVGRVRGAKLRAGAVRSVVNEPATRFANRIVPLELLFGDCAELEKNVLAADEAQGFGALEAWLRQRAARGAVDEVEWAVSLVEQIRQHSEITSVAQLCDLTGDSVRGVQRLFRDYVGASPKWVIRRNRLQEVALRIESGEAPTLAALAAELGYSDHAHLARDFKRVVGKSPRAFAQSVHG